MNGNIKVSFNNALIVKPFKLTDTRIYICHSISLLHVKRSYSFHRYSNYIEKC